MRNLGRRRSTQIIVLAGLLLVVAPSALAYWRTTGAGSATGMVGSPQTLTLSPGTASSPLYPGGQGDVALTISNPNAFGVHIGSLTLHASQGTGGFGVDSGHAACSVAALSYAAQTNGATGWTVAPKVGATNGSLSVDLSAALTMSSAAANACQGATFDVYLTAGP